MNKKKVKKKLKANFKDKAKIDTITPFLRELSIQNYKSFSKLSFVDFAPKVNLIFGKNSSGKSSILQALRLFRQSSSSEMNFEPTAYYRGRGGIDLDIGYSGIVHGGNKKKEICLGIGTGLYKDKSKSISPDVLLFNAYKYVEKFYKGDKNLISNKTILGAIIFNNKVSNFSLRLKKHNFLNKKNRKSVDYETGFPSLNPIKSEEKSYEDIYPGFYYDVEIVRKASKLKFLDKSFLSFSKTDKTKMIEVLGMILNFKSETRKNIEGGEGEFYKRQGSLIPIRKKYREQVIEKDLEENKRLEWIKENPDYIKLIYEELKFRAPSIDIIKKEVVKLIHALSKGKIKNLKNFHQYFLNDLIIKNKNLIYYEGELKHKLNDSEDIPYLDFERRVIYQINLLSYLIDLGIGPAITRDRYLNIISQYNTAKFGFGGRSISIKDNVQRIFDKMIILPGLRSLPKRYFVKGLQTNYVGSQAENLAELLANPQIRQETNNWLKKLEIPYNVGVKPSGNYYEIVFENPGNTSHKISQRHVGLGYPIILPFIVQCLIASEKIIIIEEPEIHLHPKLEADLAELIIESSIKRNNQFIIETHSEDFLLRLLKSVRLKKITPQEISINYISKPKNNSVVNKIKVNKYGQYQTPWKDNLFAERRREFE